MTTKKKTKQKITKISFTIVHSDVVPKLMEELSELRPKSDRGHYSSSGEEAIVDEFHTTMDSIFFLSGDSSVFKNLTEVVEIDRRLKTDFIFASHNEVVKFLKDEIKFAKEDQPLKLEIDLHALEFEIEEKKQKLSEVKAKIQAGKKKKKRS